MAFVVATSTFLHRPSGRMVRKGQSFAADDPIVESTPGCWRADVEQATAAPGERRNVQRRRSAKP